MPWIGHQLVIGRLAKIGELIRWHLNQIEEKLANSAERASLDLEYKGLQVWDAYASARLNFLSDNFLIFSLFYPLMPKFLAFSRDFWPVHFEIFVGHSELRNFWPFPFLSRYIPFLKVYLFIYPFMYRKMMIADCLLECSAFQTKIW